MIASLKHTFSQTVSTAIPYVNVFFRCRIANNGIIEDIANENLWLINAMPIWPGKKVHLFSKSYIVQPFSDYPFSVFNIAIRVAFPRLMFIYQIGQVVIGIFLKLFSWLFIKGVFEKNKQLIDIMAKERFQYQDWLDHPRFQASLSETYQLVVRNKEKKKTYNQFDDLPLDILKTIASYLDDLSALKTFGQVSRGCYLASRHVGSSFIRKEKEKLIHIYFPQMLQRCLGIDKLKQAPMVRLAMHRISDDTNDWRFQRLGECEIQTHLQLNMRDIGLQPIQWGIEPVPFVAVRVMQSQTNPAKKSVFERIISKIGMIQSQKSDFSTYEEGVLTISDTSANYKWNISFSWESWGFSSRVAMGSSFDKLAYQKKMIMFNLNKQFREQPVKGQSYDFSTFSIYSDEEYKQGF